MLKVLSTLALLLALASVPSAYAEEDVSASGDAAQIEDYASYAPQTKCHRKPRAGTKMLAAWLKNQFGGGGGATGRACGGGASEHKDGRAIDWTLDATKKADRRIAKAFLKTVFAADEEGNAHALARRMGIMYLIWNDQMYSAWDQFEREDYLSSSCKSKRRCSKTLRHRDHVHISLSMAGAKGRTSWYDGRKHAAHVTTPQPQPDPDPEPGPDPGGWTPYYSTEFEDLTGWSVRTETQSNDNSRNIPANVVPASVADGKGLTIWGKAESGYNRPYTSGEIHGTGAGLVLPNYFRAEVIGTTADIQGFWPALLWFRPANASDGEIDVMEYMGGLYTGTQRRIAVTMHNEYGSTQDSWKAPIYWNTLTNPSITAVHKYVIEKTPGMIKVTVDDQATRWFGTTQEVLDHLPQNGVIADKAWWDRIMENPARTWYPRITLQVGDGSVNGGKRVVPNPPAGFTADKMTVTSLKFWLPA